MSKFKLLIFDLFFVTSAIVGVGFATGKEISHFFLSGKSLMLATVIFFCIFVVTSSYFLKIKNRYNISNLTDLNKLAFGKYHNIGNIVLFILFIVTSSAMLAGGDNLAKNYLGINLPIVSVFLGVLTFLIVMDGVNRIKTIASFGVPILLVIIIVCAVCNFNMGVTLTGGWYIDMVYPIIFCCENFINFISVLLKTKTKSKLFSFISGFIISTIILLSGFAIGNISADMPMLIVSKNLGNVFFAVYLISVIFALFTTLEITSYHCLEVVGKSKKNKHFNLALILITSQIIANLGFNFIVQYLYMGVGIMGAMYLIVLIINLIIINKKLNNKNLKYIKNKIK